MKIFLMSSIIISLVIVSGCITRHNVTPLHNQTLQQQATDKEACLQMATSYDSSGKRLDFDIWHDCLKSKGYRIDPTPFNISF